ncbi:hypothetical protein K3495_g1944 [Podosphaera aphanis]|nr:hypothetical protein K3495_g1944 [Podosphaera aphanis]
MSSQQQERPSLLNPRASRQNGYDLRTLPMPESTVLADLRTYEKLGKSVETYDHNITSKWSNICRKVENILNFGDLALRELVYTNYLSNANHCELTNGRLLIKLNGDLIVRGVLTSSRDHLGVATSNLPPATNIDEALAAYEARIEAKIDTKLASIFALLENRLPGTESAAPLTLSSPAQPITRQSEGIDRESRQKEALREAQALGKAAATGLLKELSKIDRGNIGNDESDDDTELDEAGSFSRNPSLADTDEDLSPISKLPKIAARGGRGVSEFAVAQYREGLNPRPLKRMVRR